MRHTALTLGVHLVCICTVGCKQDSVLPGYQWPGDEPPASGQAGTGGATVQSGSMAGTETAGKAGAGAAAMGAAGMGAMAMAGTGSGGMGSPAPSDGGCDLSGRWIATLHLVTDTLGQQQTTHFYTYYEIARQGGGYAVTKGLHCGDDAASTGELAVMVDFEDAWPVARTKISYTGRSVSSAQVAGGCAVEFGKAYTVRGASVPHYLDPQNALPSAEQQASGTTPGWEDWDNDGQPGVTGLLSGPGATGRLFVAPRHWTELSGTVPNTMTRFRLSIDWDQEQNVMAYDPPWNLTLGTPSSRHPDDSLQFAEFVRLEGDQAAGADNNAICDAIILLAPTLTPAASAI